jgi:iron complex outermembrane receptor protein
LFTGTIPQHNDISIEQTSLEIHLNGNSGPFKWIAGTFWQDERQNYKLAADFLYGVIDYSDTPEVWDRNYAAFAQTTYSLTDDWRFTGGIRYTYDDKTEGGPGSGTTVLDPLHIFSNETLSFSPSLGQDTFRHTTYKAGLEHDLALQSLLYANVATGFHAGGIQPGSTVGPNPTAFAPETLTAYTIGLKNRFFNQTVQFNIEAYLWNYDNLQVQALGSINAADASSTEAEKVFNAGKARIDGFDSDAKWLITPNDELSLNVVYTNALYLKFYYLDLLNGPTNDSGRRFAYVPPWTETLSYMHTFNLPGGGRLEANLHSKIQSQATLAYNEPYAADTISRAYTRSDFNLTFFTPDKHWSVTGYVRNMENHPDLDLVFGNAISPGTSTEPIYAPHAVITPEESVQAPRTFGGILNYSW